MRFPVVPNWFCRTEAANDYIRVSSVSVGSPPQEFVCNSCMFEECVPPILVTRLLGRSGVGDAFESVKTDASDDIQDKCSWTAV